MPSPDYKTTIVERLFDKRWDTKERTLSDPLVTLPEVQGEIRRFNEEFGTTYSDANPANFFKDLIRNLDAANRRWPRSVTERGYAGEQRTGRIDGRRLCFAFVPLPAGQTEPFGGVIIHPSQDAPRYRMESSSLPLASRRLGRSDESWLTQVMVRLRIIETHMALFSLRNIIQVDLLQTNVKLSGSEIDAIFLAVEGLQDEQHEELILCFEAKGRTDDILINQLVRQVEAVFNRTDLPQDVVIPIAAKAIARSEIFVVEFAPILRSAASDLQTLDVAGSAIYELIPVVPGIGK